MMDLLFCALKRTMNQMSPERDSIEKSHATTGSSGMCIV